MTSLYCVHMNCWTNGCAQKFLGPRIWLVYTRNKVRIDHFGTVLSWKGRVFPWLREWGRYSLQSTSTSSVLCINHTYIYMQRYICMEVDVMMSCSNSWSHFVGSWIYFRIALSFTQAGKRIQSPPPLSTSFAYRDTSQPSVVRRSPFPTCCRPPGSWLSQKSVYK